MSAEVREGDKRIVNFRTGVDATDASLVTVKALRADDDDASTITLAHAVADASIGHFTHKTDGTLALGLYYTCVVLDFPDGTQITVPSDGAFETLEIIPAL